MRREPSVKPSGRSVSVRIIRVCQLASAAAWAAAGVRLCSSRGSWLRPKSCSVTPAGRQRSLWRPWVRAGKAWAGRSGVGVFGVERGAEWRGGAAQGGNESNAVHGFW